LQHVEWKAKQVCGDTRREASESSHGP
jgi:hypothetical protein